MSEEYGSFEEKRRHLIADIARQRGELAQAYQSLEKPINYAQSGLRGLSFLQQNSWIFVAVPAVFRIIGIFSGLRKEKSVKPPPRPRQSTEERRPKGFVGHAVKWGGHGWKLFKIYRRVRHYFS
jgi:hypothetical protein